MHTLTVAFGETAACGPSLLGHVPAGLAVEALRCLSLALRAQSEELRVLLLVLFVTVVGAVVFVAWAGSGLTGLADRPGPFTTLRPSLSPA